MKWAAWKKAIRAALDADPDFNVETDDIDFLDLVATERFHLTRHEAVKGPTLVGVQSQESPDDTNDDEN